jgi:hypothetical protein
MKPAPTAPVDQGEVGEVSKRTRWEEDTPLE